MEHLSFDLNLATILTELPRAEDERKMYEETLNNSNSSDGKVTAG
jgi:hypothetical protein